MKPNSAATILERYKVDSNGCWVWTHGRFQFGHGRIKILGCDLKAHRISWELHNGPIPEGLFVLHSCDNPPCINPEHLFLGTQQDNIDDMRAKGRQPNTKGKANGAARLSEEQVMQIKTLLREGFYTHEEIGAGFEVNRATISQIARGKNWSHLP